MDRGIVIIYSETRLEVEGQKSRLDFESKSRAPLLNNNNIK